MWGRCVAKCGSSFHLEELHKICDDGKKLKGNKTRLLFNIVPIRMSVLIQVQCILNVYAAETGGCYTTSPLCVSLCFNPHSGLRAIFLPLHTLHISAWSSHLTDCAMTKCYKLVTHCHSKQTTALLKNTCNLLNMCLCLLSPSLLSRRL